MGTEIANECEVYNEIRKCLLFGVVLNHAVCVLIKQRILLGFLTLEVGTDRLSRNVGKE
jgi:hypothetical protein